MNLTNEENVKLNPNTQVFEGMGSLVKAQFAALESRSYVFRVYNEKRTETGRKERVFHGFGVPK